VGWYFAVIDSTIDLTVNWTSMIYQYTGCHTPGSAYAQLGRSSPSIALNTAGGWSPLTLAVTETNIFTASGNHVVVPVGFDWGSSLSVKVKPFPPSIGPSSFNTRVRNAAGTVWQKVEGDSTGINSFEANGIKRGNPLHNPGASLFLEYQSEGGHADVDGTNWDVSGIYMGHGLGPQGCGGIERDLGS